MDTDYKNIPSILKQYKNFCCYDTRKETPKAPRDLKGNLLDNWSNRSLYSFNECIDSIKQGFNNGLGIVLKDNGVCILDFDKCIDRIEVNNELGYSKPIFKKDKANDTLDIINKLQSYTELSQSGKGIHIITIADIKGIYIQQPIEIYTHKKFICLTGNVLFNYYDLNDNTSNMIDLVNKYQAKPPTKLRFSKTIYNDFRAKNFKFNNSYKDADIINTMFNSKKGEYLQKLYNNELSNAEYRKDKEQKTKTKYLCNISNSEKAYTLILYLLDFCYGDIDAVKRIFKKSALCKNDYLDPRYSIKEDNKSVKIDKIDYMIRQAILIYKNYREY